MPLGAVDQTLVVAPSEVGRQVSATVLCSDTSEIVVLGLRFGRLPQPVRNVIGDQADPSNDDESLFLVRLVAGEPKALFEIAPSVDRIKFEVRRVGGEPCLLRLECVPVASVAATPSNGSASARVVDPQNNRTASKGTLRKAQDLLREGRGDRAIEVATAYASDVERPALSLLHATLAVDDDPKWLSHVNQYVEQFGISPIRLARGSASRFLRLQAEPPHEITSGPVVSVIMPRSTRRRRWSWRHRRYSSRVGSRSN